jgi:hypothetical protein
VVILNYKNIAPIFLYLDYRMDHSRLFNELFLIYK